MDAQQELFTELLLKLKAIDWEEMRPLAVYDGFMPPDDVDYPFIFLADSLQTDQSTKNGILGNVTQTIHIWNNDPHKRGTVSRVAEEIKKVCRKITNTGSYNWMIINLSQQTITDKTTSVPLMHTIITIEFKYS